MFVLFEIRSILFRLHQKLLILPLRPLQRLFLLQSHSSRRLIFGLIFSLHIKCFEQWICLVIQFFISQFLFLGPIGLPVFESVEAGVDRAMPVMIGQEIIHVLVLVHHILIVHIHLLTIFQIILGAVLNGIMVALILQINLLIIPEVNHLFSQQLIVQLHFSHFLHIKRGTSQFLRRQDRNFYISLAKVILFNFYCLSWSYNSQISMVGVQEELDFKVYLLFGSPNVSLLRLKRSYLFKSYYFESYQMLGVGYLYFASFRTFDFLLELILSIEVQSYCFDFIFLL